MIGFKKILNILLGISFVVTLLVPITGIGIHKMASAVFLLLATVHTVINREHGRAESYLLFGVILISFLSGLFGLIFDQFPIIIALHKVISIFAVFIVAVHITVNGKGFFKGRKNAGK